MKQSFPDNMDVRPFSEDDRYEVATLFRQVLEEHNLLSDAGMLTSEIARLSKRYEVEGAGFWVLISEGKVVGTVGLRPQGEYTAEIEKFYISSKLRGRGIGKNLLKFIEEQALKRGFRHIFISCSRKFIRSVQFFESANYRLVGNMESREGENLFEKEIS